MSEWRLTPPVAIVSVRDLAIMKRVPAILARARIVSVSACRGSHNTVF
jgi:hypothetical protein